MKTKSLITSMLLIAMVAITAVGKDAPSNTGMAVVQVKGSEVFKVIYKAETAGKVKLSIFNAAGQLIFAESRVAEGFILPINFSGLPTGDYTIEIADASGVRSEKITINPVKTTKGIHVAKVSEEGKFLVSVASSGKQTIGVKIYDNQNNLLHTETREISGDFAQVYAVKNANGPVTFEISDAVV
ncbi:MAG: T9SS type A sorting domain-containing protein [Bacteroidia bacterium]|nr:T9SS type A sorting domain-containing protein [Bacteroidia bacterium]